MTVLMISYDLIGQERPSAYAAVKKVIEDNAIDSRRPLYSLWWVETNDSVSIWNERMQSVTDANDLFIIDEMTRPYGGRVATQEEWDWLNARVPKT